MRGGHFVYALCRLFIEGVQPPNAAYCTEELALAELHKTMAENPEERWIIRAIWLCSENEEENPL